MARNVTYVNASPSAVWDVLSDPYAYPKWVVGSDKTLDADERWPAVGARFRVRLAFGAEDHTEVREVVPEHRIVLHAGSSRFGPAEVRIALEPDGSGTRVIMDEEPVGKLAPLRFLPPVHWVIHLRNREAMRRFTRVVHAR